MTERLSDIKDCFKTNDVSPLYILSGRLANILLSFNVQHLLSGHCEDTTCREVSLRRHLNHFLPPNSILRQMDCA